MRGGRRAVPTGVAAEARKRSRSLKRGREYIGRAEQPLGTKSAQANRFCRLRVVLAEFHQRAILAHAAGLGQAPSPGLARRSRVEQKPPTRLA